MQLPPPAKQLARMYSGLASDRRRNCATLHRRCNHALLLGSRPSPALPNQSHYLGLHLRHLNVSITGASFCVRRQRLNVSTGIWIKMRMRRLPCSRLMARFFAASARQSRQTRSPLGLCALSHHKPWVFWGPHLPASRRTTPPFLKISPRSLFPCASRERQQNHKSLQNRDNPKRLAVSPSEPAPRAQPRSQVTSDGNSVPNNRPSTKKTIKRTMFMGSVSTS
jgi:hypothetical protein